MSLGEQRDGEIGGQDAVGGGVLGQHVRWAGTGPRNAFGGNGLRERVEGLAFSQMRGGLTQGGKGHGLAGDRQGSMCGGWVEKVRRPISRARSKFARSDMEWQGGLEVPSRTNGQWPSGAWGWWQGRAGEG